MKEYPKSDTLVRTKDYDSFPDGMLDEIERFLVTDSHYLDVFTTARFFPLQRKNELKAMLSIASLVKPKVVYEIGADKGGSLYCWCKFSPSVERVIACEVRGTPYKKLFERAFPKIDFLWIEESSFREETVDLVSGWLGDDSIDCLFIDGDKSNFLTDFEQYIPMVSPFGIVFMHDIQDEHPGRDYQSVVRKGYKTVRLIDTTESVELVLSDKEPKDSYESWLLTWYGRSAGVGVIFNAKL